MFFTHQCFPRSSLPEPCIPEHISTQYSLTIGQVLWDMTAGADYYTVEGVTEQGRMVSCTTNDTYCAMYSMNCGQMYSINVTANNHVCQGVSTSTETVIIMTGENKRWENNFFNLSPLERRCIFSRFGIWDLENFEMINRQKDNLQLFWSVK